MKAVSFVIIVYVVFMLTQPCQDIAVFAGPCNKEIASYADIEVSESKQETSDICPPLCICSCCGISAANHFASEALLPNRNGPVALAAPVSYERPYPAPFPNSIWQPPKA